MSRFAAIVILAGLCAWSGARASQPSSAPATISVIVTGTGTSEKEALEQALTNAVQQAAGTLVDAETLVQDDQIVREKVLTYSSAIVTQYDRVGSVEIKGALTTIKIKADVERRGLVARLTEANVIRTKVEGKDLFAQAVTSLREEQDAKAVLKRIFDGFPANVLRAEAADKPQLVQKDAQQAVIAVPVEFVIDQEKYRQWVTAFAPFLAKIATKSEPLRWEMQNFVGVTTLTGAADQLKLEKMLQPLGQRDLWTTISIPKDVWSTSFTTNGNIRWLPPAYRDSHVLAVVEQQGRTSSATVYTLTPDLYGSVREASFTAPMVEVSLQDSEGNELSGCARIAIFGLRNGWRFHANPFWWGEWGDLGDGPYQSLAPALSDALRVAQNDKDLPAHWRPDFDTLKSDRSTIIMILPYLPGHFLNDALVPRVQNSYGFTIPLDQLSKVDQAVVKLSMPSTR